MKEYKEVLKNIDVEIDMPKHEFVREQLLKMQKINGSAINPIGLDKEFFTYLQENKKNNMNKVQARTLAQVFSALCNEFYIMAEMGSVEHEFYMAESRWAKYMLGQKAISNSIKILEEIGFISTRIGQHPYIPQNKVRYYRISLLAIDTLRVHFKNNNPKAWG